MNRSLLDKVAIVSGAGPGIGRSTALALARDGADVVVAARRPDALQALAREVESLTQRRVLAIPTDVAEAEQSARLVAETVQTLGRLDVLVNVATRSGPRASVVEMDWEGYADAIAFNVVASMRLCGLAAERMAESDGGSIINIGALSSTTLIPKLSRYTSSKAAMVVASKTMAREVGRKNIRVNVVTPGFTAGAALDQMFEQMAKASGADAAELSARAAREAALGRHVDPEDIADAVTFLASDRARNITGVELHVNAGQWVG